MNRKKLIKDCNILSRDESGFISQCVVQFLQGYEDFWLCVLLTNLALPGCTVKNWGICMLLGEVNECL